MTLKRKILTYLAGATLAFAGASAPVIEVDTGYFVRTAPVEEAQFKELGRDVNIKGLTEAHVVGTACYNEFRDPKGEEKTIRSRIDCNEHFKYRDTPDLAMPSMEGRTWYGYSTLLFDTPSGDLEEGYYAKSGHKELITPAQAALEGLVPEKAKAAVTYDAATGLIGSSVNTVSFSHTTASNAVLILGVALQDTTNDDRKVTSCTYNSVQLFRTNELTAFTNFFVAMYEYPKPASGANTVFCTFNDSSAASVPSDSSVGAISVTGADREFPIESSATNSGNAAGSTITLTTKLANSLLVDVMITDETNATNITAGGDLHTERLELENTGENTGLGTAGPVVTAGATTTTWSWPGAENWVAAAVGVREPCASPERCTDLITTTGTSTWTAPTGVSSVDVACWGAGGGGGVIANSGGGGGGGGAYASTTSISVTAGVGYSVHVGVGGNDEAAGANSQFYNGTTYSPIACGGSGGIDGAAGAGGTTACSIGSAAEFAGGTGGAGDAGTSDAGGGGGGAAGPDGAGGTGSTGSSVSPGGKGGTGDNGSGGEGGYGGSNTGNNGATGVASRKGGGGSGGAGNATAALVGGYPGGGGGGSETDGGVGADGMCQISYTAGAGGPADPVGNAILYLKNAELYLRNAGFYLRQ